MSIQKTTNISFKAKIEPEFYSSVMKYYNKRNLPDQMRQFDKFVDRFECMGDENSTIIYKGFKTDDGFDHYLYLKNTDINDQDALCLYNSGKFTDVLKFFTTLNHNTIEYFEDLLK